MMRGLVLAMVLGLLTFFTGWSSIYEIRGSKPVALPPLPTQVVPTTELAQPARPQPARPPPEAVARIAPHIAPQLTARTGASTLRVRSVPEPREWSECNFSRLERHYPEVIAAERASPAAIRETRVLPTIFVPCCPKAGTTFLNQCIARAFHPAAVCHDANPSAWATSKCANKSYVLGGVRTNMAGLYHEVKEPFYFNKETVKIEPGAARDIKILAGPPTPLCVWNVPKHGAPTRVVNSLRGQGLRDEWNRLFARPRYACNVSTLPPPRATPPLETGYFPEHAWPGCRLVKIDQPNALKSDFRDTVQFKVAYPLRAELPMGHARTYDMTPNYLCSSHALRLMRERYGPELARQARFIVMLRDPVARAYSEFSMFRNWGWEMVSDFGQAITTEVQRLRQCLRNDTLLLRPLTIAEMEPARVVEDVMRCGSGDARQYIRNSMYETCIAGAYAYFERSQFMFIFSEDLRVMPGAEVMEKVQAFTGLSLEHDENGKVSRNAASRCDTGHQAGSGHQLPNHQTRGKMSAEIKARLQRFFAPSRAALARLIEGSFQSEQPLARLRTFAEADLSSAGETRDLREFGIDTSVRPRPRRTRPPAGVTRAVRRGR
jgi:hypothetical protein